MSIKRSPAARVIEFFTAAPVGEAELVYGLVKEVIRKRKANEVAIPVGTTVVVRRRPRKAKVNARAAIDTVIPTQPVA